MGCRSNLGVIKKNAKVFEKADDDEDSYFEMIDVERSYELGKYFELRPDGENIHPNPDDQEFYYADKNFLITLIDYYRQQNENYFNQLNIDFEIISKQIKSKEDVDKKLIGKLSSYFISKRKTIYGEWSKDRLDNLIENNRLKDVVTNSWLYEYAIFNLIHLLRTIDWENEDLVFYAG